MHRAKVVLREVPGQVHVGVKPASLLDVCNFVRMSRIIRVRLTGAEAQPGQIAAADVARAILGLERAIARAAYIALGRSRQGATGRHTAAVAAASRLRFVGTEPGSFVGLLALPEVGQLDNDGLDFTVEDLSRRAFEHLVFFIQAPAEDADAQLAAAVAQLADELGVGERTDTLTLGEGDPARPSAVINIAVRQQMRRLSQHAPSHRDDLVVGTLYEADFERHTARLRIPPGGMVTVTFGPDMADDIQQALRSEAQLEGRVRYDRRTGVASSIETRTVTRAEQLLMRDGDWLFTENLSVAELQQRLGVEGRVNVADLATDDLTEEERDAFVEALRGT